MPTGYSKNISTLKSLASEAAKHQTKQIEKGSFTAAINQVASTVKTAAKKSLVPKIVQVALNQVGTRASNGGHQKYTSWYPMSSHTAWCACFVSWCASQAGVLGSHVPKYASCTNGGMPYFKRKGALKIRGSGYTPKPGDVIFFNWNGGTRLFHHTGIVEKVSGGKVYTIEGNSGATNAWNGMVRKKTYALSSRVIAAYGATGLYGTDDGFTGTSGSFAPANETINPDTGRYVTDSESAAYAAGGYGSAGQAVAASTPQTYDITKVRVLSTDGMGGARKFTSLRDMPGVVNQGVELLIQNDKIYLPIVEGDITLSYERKNTPGTLKFNVMKDDLLNFQEGNPVRLRVNGQNVFYGYVFTKSRKDNRVISVTAYDQLRYLKNKDTLAYSGKTYAELLKMIAKDYNLTVGDVANTGYVIPSRIEETTLFDMLGNASDLTWQHTKVLYILYDDFGRLALKNPKDMMVPILVDADTAGEFSYETTIDKDVYNKVKIATDDDTTGYRNVRVYNGTENQRMWGVLQYYEKLDGGTASDAKFVAGQVLEYCNTKNRNLKISKVFGDLRVRGGSQVLVQLNLGDLLVQNWMSVEKVTHTFSNGSHFMDLSVVYSGVGGEFRA